MDAEDQMSGRCKIIATAIAWGGNPSTFGRPHDPRLIRLLLAARDYGLPPLLPGQTELQWALSVRDGLRAERQTM
jgi:hypothetical protein